MSPADRKGRICPYQLGSKVFLTLNSFGNPIKSFRKDHLACQSLKMIHVKTVNRQCSGGDGLGWFGVNLWFQGGSGTIVLLCVFICAFCFVELIALL